MMALLKDSVVHDCMLLANMKLLKTRRIGLVHDPNQPIVLPTLRSSCDLLLMFVRVSASYRFRFPCRISSTTLTLVYNANSLPSAVLQYSTRMKLLNHHLFPLMPYPLALPFRQ
jgi:hypothetical protein